MYKLSTLLRSLSACDPALTWLAAGHYPTFADAWNACPKHDWLLWVIGHTMSHRKIVALACDLAEPSLAYTSDPRPAACIAVVRRWVRGEATLEEVRAARAAALTTYALAIYAANAAIYAADAVAYAADAADDAATYAQSLAQSRDIIRARFPAHVIEARLVEIGRERDCLEVAS